MTRAEFNALLDKLQDIADTPQPGIPLRNEWPMPVLPSDLRIVLQACRDYNDLVDGMRDAEEGEE